MINDKYINDQLESQPWSRKMGQVQVITAGDKNDTKKERTKSFDKKENPIKKKIAKKMKN